MRSTSRTRDKDLGVIQALLSRMNTFRLPRALKLKEQVEKGEPLSASDLRFLKQALSEGGEARRLAARHPKYQGVVDEMTALYTEIIRKGADNERAGASRAKKPTPDQY